jgi:predicted ATPase
MPITFVVGLPGSGKSTWIEQQAQGTDALVIHDFKARSHSHNNDPAFHSSRHLPELIAAVESGRNSFIADLDFCRTASRNEAGTFLARAFPEVRVALGFL